MSYSSRPHRVGLLVALVGICPALLGCSDPVASSIQPSADAPELLPSVAPRGLRARVRGGAHFRLRDAPPEIPFKWVYRFSFKVDQFRDGSVQGRVKFSSHIPPGRDPVGFPGDWNAEAAIDCLVVDGNTAWMTGEVVHSRTDSPIGPPVGDIAMFIVQDNDASGPDVVNVGPAAFFGASDCHDRPAIFPEDRIVDGNVKIRTY